MKQTKITFNLSGLEYLQRQVGKEYKARVGILGDKASRGDGVLNNAEIGVVQMFGSFANNIPPRDFLLFPVEHNQREIARGMGSASVKEAVKRRDYKTVFKLLGALAEAAIQEAFQSGGFGQWAPNASSTIDAKGSSAPLIDTAQLRRAISSEVVKKGQGVV